MSLWHVLTQPVGFQAENRTAIQIGLPNNVNSRTAAWARLRPELMQLPGVRNASLTGMIPFTGNHIQGGISKIGAKTNLIVNMPAIDAHFFSTLNIPLVAGRAYTPAEIANHASVIILNEQLAEHFFGSARNAVGKTLNFNYSGYENPRIVGVAHNFMWSPTPEGVRPFTAFLPVWVFPESFRLIVHTDGSISQRTLEHVVKKHCPAAWCSA